MSCVIFHNGELAADRRIMLAWRYGQRAHIEAKKLFVSSKKEFAAAFLGYHFPEHRWPAVESVLRRILIEEQDKTPPIALSDKIFSTISASCTLFVLTSDTFYFMDTGCEMQEGALLFNADTGLPSGGGTGFSAARIACQETDLPLTEVIPLVAKIDNTVSSACDSIHQKSLKPLPKKGK